MHNDCCPVKRLDLDGYVVGRTRTPFEDVALEKAEAFFFLGHPHARLAIWLAHRLRGAPPHVITATLNASDCPRGLFILAAVLLVASTRGL